MSIKVKILCVFVFFFYHPLPFFSLAALVQALHVRPSCYYKLLGGLTSLIANTDNGTILTQRQMSTGKSEILSARATNSSKNRCFDLIKSNWF